VEPSKELLHRIHKWDSMTYLHNFLLVLVEAKFSFYIPAGQHQMVKTAKHKATLHWDCLDIAQLHLPGMWAFLYFINQITWKPQLELASAVGSKEVDSELLPLPNNVVLMLNCSPASCAWIERPTQRPSQGCIHGVGQPH
jgi:hypothetical protein